MPTRRALALVALVACSGGGVPAHTSGKALPPLAVGFSAAQWIPDKPAYAIAAHQVRDVQRSLHDAFDWYETIFDIDPAWTSRWFTSVFAVDALSADAVTAIGVDVDGGFAMFSEALNPTFVVHLASPELIASFFDRLHERGLVSDSVIVDGTEIYTATLRPGYRISWAVAKDWLWVHFGLPIAHDDGTTWFTTSRTASHPTWGDAWSAAAAAAPKASVVGFADLRGLVASVVSRAPDAIDCAKLVEPVGRLSIGLDGDGRHVGVRLGVELGAAAATVGRAILPPPAGWDGVVASAPIAAQWNVDLGAAQAWLAPCARALRIDLGWLAHFEVRSARVAIATLDTDALTGTGVASFNLSGRSYFASWLDTVPGRSAFEQDRNFGPYPGHSLAIPFAFTLDYVLTDQLALAGVGEGLLAKAIGSGAGQSSTLAAFDVRPSGLSAETWIYLLDKLDYRSVSRSLVDRFRRWQDLHLGAIVDGSRIVLEATGNRR